MNILIIFGIAAGCILAERLWPAMELPRVNAWWGRVILINSFQLGITFLAGQTWNRWMNHGSLFHVSVHMSDWSAALSIYLFSTFVYYWWHRYRHESSFFWRTLHQIHHSARRLEIVTSFYKHPRRNFDQLPPEQRDRVSVVWRQYSRSRLLHSAHRQSENSFTTGISRHPHGSDSFFSGRNHIGCTTNFSITPTISPTSRYGTCSSERLRIQRNSKASAAMRVGEKTDSKTCSSLEMFTHQPRRKVAPLHFLPTCLGCSKRWACSASAAVVETPRT